MSMGLNVKHTVPNKMTLKKLQLKHAVTADLKKVELALDAFQKATEKETLLGVMPSLNRLYDAIKKWKSENGKKHAKFVKGFDDSFGKPLDKLLKVIEDNRKMPQTINNWRKEGLQRCNEAAKIFTSPMDASKIAAARKAVEKIGAPLNGIATSADNFRIIGDKSMVWNNLFQGAGKAKKEMAEIDKVLFALEKKGVDNVEPKYQQGLLKLLAPLVKTIDGLRAPLS